MPLYAIISTLLQLTCATILLYTAYRRPSIWPNWAIAVVVIGNATVIATHAYVALKG